MKESHALKEISMLVNMIGNLTPIVVSKLLEKELVGTAFAQTPLCSIATDSRECTKDSLFVAVKGENSDGHLYLLGAVKNGAICAIVERIPENAPDICYVIVEDSVKALGTLAAKYKSAIHPLTVAVTGSVGKTTTKEFIYAVLSQKYKTLKTEGNHNNHLGMPMTLMGLDSDHKAAVLEMGMSGFGEISYLSRIGTPDIAIITNIGTSHIEKLGSREGIRNAKLEIADGMGSDGVIILNGDEPLLDGIDDAYYVSMTGRRAYANVSNIVTGENGTAFDLTILGECVESIVIPAQGEHNVMNAAYAFVVGKLVGMGEAEIRNGLMSFKNVGLRQKVTQIGGVKLIEDCYNASPESMGASLKLLYDESVRSSMRSVAVLGEMRELGSYSETAHVGVGAKVAELGIDMLFTFGEKALGIADGAIRGGMDPQNVVSVTDLSDYEGLVAKIVEKTSKNDVILFKASRAIALENAAEILKKEISKG